MPLQKKTVEQEFQDLLAKSLQNRESVREELIEEMRRMFFAGCLAMLSNLESCGDPDVPRKEGAAYMEALMSEVVAFFDKLTKEANRDRSRRN